MCMSTLNGKELFPTLADRAVCINLIERDDRMKEAQEQFRKVGLLGTVQFHRVERHPRGGRYGCYNSHREVMANALKDGLDSVLIFEDDVQFEDGWEDVVCDAKSFIDEAEKNTNKKFDAFFLGSRIFYIDEKVSTKVWRVKCGNAHAYIISKSGMENFVANQDKFERGIHALAKDMIQMSIWQHMYAHTSTDAIIQAPFLGTDNYWTADVPQKYVPWFQIKIIHKLSTVMQPLIRNDLYQKSWFGQTYVIGIGETIIDDGRIKLYPCPFVEVFLAAVLILTTKPPFGYFALCHEFLWPVFFSRLLPILLSPLRWCYSSFFKVKKLLHFGLY